MYKIKRRIELLNQPYVVIKYLDNPISKDELLDILKKLNYKPCRTCKNIKRKFGLKLNKFV